MFFFFFQAEDGIRDIGVTGVQTCALPIFGYDNNVMGANSSAIGYTNVVSKVSRDSSAVGYKNIVNGTSANAFGSENEALGLRALDRKSTRLNSSHANISYAVFCLKKKKKSNTTS